MHDGEQRERASLTLHVSKAALKCRACARPLTVRQREHALPSWREQGGEEHDRILRLLAGRGKTTRSARRRASRLIDELLAADQDRLAAVSELAHAALLASAVFEYEFATRPTETDLAVELAAERLVPLQPPIHRASRDSGFFSEIHHPPLVDVPEHRPASPPAVQIPSLLCSLDEANQLAARRRRPAVRTDRLSRPRSPHDHLLDDRGTMILCGSIVNSEMDLGLRDPV